MNKHKAIFLDWNRTLSNSLFWEQMADPKHKHNPHHADIVKWLFIDNKSLINPWMRGDYSSEDISKMIGTSIGLSYEIILNELAESCRNMKFVSAEIPGLIKAIKRKGIKAIIATDNMDTFRKFTMDGMRLNEIFDDYLISCELGKLKGDFGEKGQLLFFEDFMKANKLVYEETILLDDCLDDAGTMDKAGLKIIQITSPEVLVNVLNDYAS
ncbi:hypothetical protein HYT59_00685 [Candidatus Woesebacteria bacterium]|nr:hypothetical protein [Candidatus Woesebacteria bacterium]